MKIDDDRTPERFFANPKNWAGVGEANRKLFAEFDREKSAQGASDGTRYMYLFCLVKLAKHFNGRLVSRFVKADLIDFFDAWKHFKSPSLKVSIKAFYKWLNKGVYPDSVAWVKTHGFTRRKLPEDILTPEEVKRLADSCINQRDRALILLLYETGARAGELIGLNIKDVVFDEFGAVLMLDGKTGMRRVRVIDCVPDLKVWLNNHPRAKDASAPLFLELRGKFEALGNHATLAHILDTARERSGLQKRVYPHLFRHSRATHLAKEFTEQELKIIFGWSGGSRMPATYVHLSGADLDKKMLEKRGLLAVESQKARDELKPIVCHNCNNENSSTARFCGQCGIAFSLKDALEAERKKAEASKLVDSLSVEELKNMLTRKVLSEQQQPST